MAMWLEHCVMMMTMDADLIRLFRTELKLIEEFHILRVVCGHFIRAIIIDGSFRISCCR